MILTLSVGCFVRVGKNGMGCFVRGDKNGMGCYVRGDKNSMGCFVRDGKSLWDVLSGVVKNDMGCFVPGCFVPLPCTTHKDWNHQCSVWTGNSSFPIYGRQGLPNYLYVVKTLKFHTKPMISPP